MVSELPWLFVSSWMWDSWGGAGTGAIVLNGGCRVLESPYFNSMQYCWGSGPKCGGNGHRCICLCRKQRSQPVNSICAALKASPNCEWIYTDLQFHCLHRFQHKSVGFLIRIFVLALSLALSFFFSFSNFTFCAFCTSLDKREFFPLMILSLDSMLQPHAILHRSFWLKWWEKVVGFFS